MKRRKLRQHRWAQGFSGLHFSSLCAQETLLLPSCRTPGIRDDLMRDGPSSVFHHTLKQQTQTKQPLLVYVRVWFWLCGSFSLIYSRTGARGGETNLAQSYSPTMRHPPALNVTLPVTALRQQTMLKSAADKTPPHWLLIWIYFHCTLFLCYGDKIDKFIFFSPHIVVYTFSNLNKYKSSTFTTNTVQ